MSARPTPDHSLPWQQRRRRRHAALRGALGTATAAFGAVALCQLAWTTATQAAARPTPVDAVQVTALGLAGLAAAWLAVLLALATATFLPGIGGAWGRRLGALVAPGPCLRIAAVLLGTGLASTATSASAMALPVGAGVVVTAPAAHGLPDPSFGPPDAGPGGPHRSAGAADSCLPSPGWQPSRAKVRRETSDVSLVSRCPAGDDPARLVVHRGDTLWRIAARHLGPEATAAEVARAWPRWYAANRSVIGDDPDLLLPGQVLTAPQEAR